MTDEQCHPNCLKSSYAGERKSLGPVSLKIQRGECSLLVGANGSGKSSILEAVAGFLQVESGTIRIGGKNHPWTRVLGMSRGKGESVGSDNSGVCGHT